MLQEFFGQRRGPALKNSDELKKDYDKALLQFSGKREDTKRTEREEKDAIISETFTKLARQLHQRPDFSFDAREQAILKLKLAYYFQHNTFADVNTLFDAIIESPKFLSEEKGSLRKLLDVHEMKTLQKIAELKKKKADMTDDGSLNPYEALFTTISGKYYCARLLNMPHLERESSYLDHCVGTSDSYINKIKRGDIEIFSLRSIGEWNEEKQRYDEDIPVMTIEYNVRTGIIEQMKKRNDELLKSDDDFYSDVLDTIRQLSHGENDAGKPRRIQKVEPSEIENIVVKDGYILTNDGEISLANFDVKSGLIVMKLGRYDLLKRSKENIVKLLKILKNIDCELEQIALSKNDITENTTVYLGKLVPGIFTKLPRSIEHIYTAFPEEEVQIDKNVVYGGKTPEEMKQELHVQGNQTNTQSEFLLNKLLKDTKQESADVIRLSVADMGFPRGATRQKIYNRAEKLGLKVNIPPELGPAMRLRDKNQQEGTRYFIGMKPIIGLNGRPNVFFVSCLGAGFRWLSTSEHREFFVWNADSVWAFVRQ